MLFQKVALLFGNICVNFFDISKFFDDHLSVAVGTDVNTVVIKFSHGCAVTCGTHITKNTYVNQDLPTDNIISLVEISKNKNSNDIHPLR